jgi:hypothetical protein
METATQEPAAGAAIEHSEEITAIAEAISAAQAKIKNAERDADNPFFSSSYATLASVWDVVRGPLTENGLSVLQGEKIRINADRTGGDVDVSTLLLHKSGQWFRTTITLPVIPMSRRKKNPNDPDGDNDADRAPGKVTPQAIGSAITYGRRYGLESLTGVAPEAEDDDGNAGSGQAAGPKHTPIPEDGIFDDTIVSVTFRDQRKKEGGTFKLAVITTGAHSVLESYEREGLEFAKLAGTGEVLKLHTERPSNPRYAPKLKAAERIKAPEGEPRQAAEPAPMREDGRRAAPQEDSPPAPSGQEPWEAESLEVVQTRSLSANCRTIEALRELKDSYFDRGGKFWTAEIKAIINQRYKEITGEYPPIEGK